MAESTLETQRKPNRLRIWIIRIGVLIVLIAILVGINFVYENVTDTPTILTGDAGDLLYVSTFDEFLDEWQLYEGQQSAEIQDDTLSISVSEIGQAAWSVAKPIFADFDATMTTTAIEGPIDNSFGIIFRLQSQAESACNLSMIILCDVANITPILGVPIRLLAPKQSTVESIHYYTFLISSDGYYSVWEVSNGQEKQLSAWIPSPIINLDLESENTIRVVARGDQFQFFINGEQMLVCIPDDKDAVSTYSGGECLAGTMQTVLTDDSISHGQIGGAVQSTLTGGGGVVVQFDNVIVFSPSKNVERAESNA